MYGKIGFRSFFVIFLFLFIFKGIQTFKNSGIYMHKPFIETQSIQDIIALFDHDASAITQITENVIDDAQKQIDTFLSVPMDQRSWHNTAYVYDRIIATSDVAIWGSIVYFLKEISTDQSVRDAAHNAILKMNMFFVDFQMNPAIYRALKTYAEQNALSDQLDADQRYFITEVIKDLERSGLGLSPEKQVRVKELKNKLGELCLSYSHNIAADQTSITVSPDLITGMPSTFVSSLQKTEDGVVLGIDYPTYFGIQKHCTNAEVRKALYRAFANRAYPVNEKILQEIIATRDMLARELGYESYAAYELADEMVQSVARAEQFLSDVLEKAHKKAAQEYALFTKELPEGICLNNDGTLKPWDVAFVLESFKKKHYQIDEQHVAEYFPMEKTIEGLLSIYEQFLSLRLEQVEIPGLWHSEVRALSVYDKDTDALLGYILLDLHPRPFKYSHACAGSIVPATVHNDKSTVQVSIVLANFPKGEDGKPALLKLNDVRTFFHEFGHAIHYILGRQRIASMAGANVKRDFVEMPSQMLEEWLWDKEMLAMISSHYVTGKSLPNELIDTLIAIKNIDEGLAIQRQLSFGFLSLDCFKEGAQKDVQTLCQASHQKCRPNVAFDDESHMHTSFGHLTGYGARYYGYLWSKVFALDLFNEIKKHGLLDPVIGKKYRDCVIGKGGSKDPNELLKDFLEREPNSNAFFNDLGLQ